MKKAENFKKLFKRRLRFAKPGEFEAISIGVNDLQNLNRRYGTGTNEKLMDYIEELLENTLAPKYSLVYRYLGDRFWILQKLRYGVEIQSFCLQTLIPAIRDTINWKDDFSISVGVYRVENTTESLENIFHRADLARIKAKKKKKTNIVYFDQEMEQERFQKECITSGMEDALGKREFTLRYQPKVDLNSLHVVGLEALVRWKSSSCRTLVPPSDFIPIFEENGFVIKLDLYVLEEVCSFICRYRDHVYMPPVSMNFSAKTLLYEGLIGEIEELLDLYAVKSEEIEIEITESLIEADMDALEEVVNKLKSMGFKIAIDDFGVGASSLNRMSHFEVHTLKLDKEFLRCKAKEERRMKVIEYVIQMAKSLHMSVVCEGVELLEEVEWLREIGCDMAQGYYFSKAIEENELVDEILIKR